MKTTPALVTLYFIFSGCCFVLAQNGTNPFDIVSRVEKTDETEVEDTAKMLTSSDNPFDIVAPLEDAVKKESPGTAVQEEREAALQADRQSAYRRFIFIVIMLDLVLLTVIVTLLRLYIQKVFRAFANDNMLNQIYREWEAGMTTPFLLLYAFSLLNAGLFIFLVIRRFGISVSESNELALLFCIGGISGLLLLKHLLLGILGYVFPLSKETSLYGFSIIIFSIVIGLILAPANLFLAYTSESVTLYVVYITFAVIGLIYLLRYLRALFSAKNFLLFHKFHFLLYICTVEIAPILILIRLILNFT